MDSSTTSPELVQVELQRCNWSRQDDEITFAVLVQGKLEKVVELGRDSLTTSVLVQVEL